MSAPFFFGGGTCTDCMSQFSLRKLDPEGVELVCTFAFRTRALGAIPGFGQLSVYLACHGGTLVIFSSAPKLFTSDVDSSAGCASEAIILVVVGGLSLR